MIIMTLNDNQTYTNINGCAIIDASPDIVSKHAIGKNDVRAIVAAFRMKHDGIVEMHIPNDWKGVLQLYTDSPSCTIRVNDSEV